MYVHQLILNLRALSFLVLTLSLASIAIAQPAGTNASAVARSGSGPTVVTQNSDPISVQSIAEVGATRAWASADNNYGLMRVLAESDSGQFSVASASGSMVEKLTFQNGFGLPATLYWVFNANISKNNGYGNGETFASLQVVVGSVNQTFGIGHGCGSYGFDSCTAYPNGTVVPHNQVGRTDWTIAPGTIDFYANLRASAYGFSEWADASHTARFYLEVPNGVTFSSVSGSFLANASPIPENGTGVLLLIGVCIVCSIKRRTAIENSRLRLRNV